MFISISFVLCVVDVVVGFLFLYFSIFVFYRLKNDNDVDNDSKPFVTASH